MNLNSRTSRRHISSTDIIRRMVVTFPHVQELYLKNLCDIVFEANRIVLQAKFTNKEWTLWCLKLNTGSKKMVRGLNIANDR